MEGEKKIYFLYNQYGDKNNIKKFITNESIKEVKEEEVKKCNEYIQILYCVKLPSSKNEGQVKISLIDNETDYYYSFIPLNSFELSGKVAVDSDDSDEFVFFNLRFMIFHKNENNNLKQFILPLDEQLEFFEKKFQDNEYNLINLYSSAIAQILLKTNQKFEIILYIFFKLFDERKINDISGFKSVLKYFFQNIDKILINSEHKEILKIEKDKLDLLSNTDSIRTKLIKLTEVKEENIDLFLAYYYIHYGKKLFIKFINNNKYKESIKKNLLNHRKIFGDFTTEIINPELIDETEDVPELVSLMELYPNMVEFFKILTNKLVFCKFTNFKLLYGRGINPMLIFKPNIDDDIYLLEKYFKQIYALFLKENIYPIIIKENFFFDYYKCFEKKDEDFHKNLIIIDMLNLYNSRLSKKLDKDEILNLHFKRGISLLKNKQLKNEDFMKFIKSIPDKSKKEELIKWFPDGIEFSEENKTFNEDILNNDKYELKELLGKNYYRVFEKIFEKFNIPKELLELRKWQLNDQTPWKIIEIFMETIKRIWIRYPENNMYGLENLFASVFSKASICMDNYLNIIKALEEKIDPEKLMNIYSIILLKNFEMKYQFREHIIKFIRSYNNLTAIYLWFFICTYSDRDKRIEILTNKLNEGFAVKYDDFADYPKRANGRILLFTKLKNNQYIPEIFGNTEYYKRSMDSKNNLEKNIFKNAMIMDINLQKIFSLLSMFFCKHENEIIQLEINIVNFRDKVEKGKKYYESLKTIKKFWETFLKKTNKEKLEDLKKKIEKFENTELKDVETEEKENQEYLSQNLKEAEEGVEFIDSIFFMEIYNKRFSNLKDKESVRYNASIAQFKMLEQLGINNDVNSLKDDLKKIIINVVEKKINLLNGELEFIKKYFNFDQNDKYKNFNIRSLRNNIINLVNIRPNEELIEELDNDNGDEVIEEPHDKENPDNVNKEEINKIKGNIEYLSKEILYNSIIFENNKDHGLYTLFFQFYTELFKIGLNLAIFNQKEIVSDFIYPSKKVFYIGKNLGIIDNNQMNANKDDLLLIKEFNFVINIIKTFGKILKKNYVSIFTVFEKLLAENHKQDMDIEDLDNLLKVLKEIISKYDTNYIYIVIFLINLKMINNKKELLNYMLDKKNNELFGDLFPILDDIFSNEIEEKFKFKDIQNANNKNYFQFNSEIFSEINNKIENKDTLGQILFFYFENKIMNELDKKQKERENQKQKENDQRSYIERNLENFRYYLEFLEKNYQDNKKENFLPIIFALAFLKSFIYKVIKFKQENNDNFADSDYLFGDILKFKEDSSKLSPYRTSIKLYILKLLIYNHGNFSDVKNFDLSKYLINDLKPYLESNEKEFGFDYMFIPIQLDTDINIYNSIVDKFFNEKKIFSDKNIINEINGNVDILYCLFTNFHFSHYYNKDYFNMDEYNNAKNYFTEIKDNILKDELIKKIFDYFINFETKNIYKEFNYFDYDQILSLLISARFVISLISSKDEKCLFYNLLVNAEETINNNEKYFNEYYLKDFDRIINDKRNINCLTYTIINYILLSNFYFGFKLNLITYDNIKKVNLFKVLEGKKTKEISDYLLDQLFKEFNFIKKTLLPLLGINSIIIFMNSLFKEIHEKLIIFQIDDSEEKIKNNEREIDSIVNTVINNFSKTVKEYYAYEKKPSNENNNDIKTEMITVGENSIGKEIFDIIMEKPEFYNNENLINQKYPFLSYYTYTNYFSLNDDFKNQYFYFNNTNSDYPLIGSVLSEDNIFKILEQLPKLKELANKAYNTINMRYTEEEIHNKTIENIFNNNLNEYILFFNSIIESDDELFNQDKKISIKSKIFELINLPGSSMNHVYEKITEKYNSFISGMTFANKKEVNENEKKQKDMNLDAYKIPEEKDINLKNIKIDEVLIKEAKESDYNFNYLSIDNKKVTIKEKLEELAFLYSKRERNKENKINVYDGGKIIYNFQFIEKKLKELFIFGRKKFSKNKEDFIFSSDIFNQEANIIKDFEKKYSQGKIKDDDNKKMEDYISKKDEEEVLNLFYELFFVFKYLTRYEVIKLKNENDLIKYFELKQYEIIHLKTAIKQLNKSKNILTLNSILHFYKIVLNKAFNDLTKNIKKNIEKDTIDISEETKKNIEECLEKNEIIKIDTIISAMKMYILRNIKGKNEDNYLFNLKDLRNKDLWDMTIYGTKKFNEEFDKLIELVKGENEKDMKNVVNYLYSKIYDINIEEEENEGDD